jgi:2-(1,2-epoxy-1,2-dihydrophenyl)acetyl-CoA isomerase
MVGGNAVRVFKSIGWSRLCTDMKEGGWMEAGKFRGFEVAIHEPGIVWVQFNRPERLNGLTAAIKRDLIEILVEAQMDDAARVVVIAGSEEAFSAGDDISGHLKKEEAGDGLVPDVPQGFDHPMSTYGALRMYSQRLNLTIRELDKLTIAAMDGWAIQTGFSLALACDFRIAASTARRGSATLRFGLMPDEGGHYLLIQHIGLARAMDFLMRKRIVGAEEALKLGLVNEVVERGALNDRAMGLARELANGPQAAMRMLKRSLYVAADASFAEALEDIASKTPITDFMRDTTEGMDAFLEKRAPQFNEPFDYETLRATHRAMKKESETK